MKGNTLADRNTKNVKIARLLNTYVIFRELSLIINCEVNLILTCSSDCFITTSIVAGTFAIISVKLYVPEVSFSTQYNEKLLQHLESNFKRTFNWNKYQSKVKLYDTKNPFLDFLTDPSFQEVNRVFPLLFENNADRTTYTILSSKSKTKRLQC